ncbi:MAG: hypothetical protein Q9227_003650 [Pyrenula ochraceoflavens]
MFIDSFYEMQKWAERAADRLQKPDNQPQQRYFYQLFTAPDDLHYPEYVESVKNVFGGISKFTPVPNSDRSQANFRYYCDNDPLPSTEDSSRRWTVRDDPPEPDRPEGYILQKNRRFYNDPDRPQYEAWQEYQDQENEMLAHGDIFCSRPEGDREPVAITYVVKSPTPLAGRTSEQPDVRATVTVGFRF